MSTAPPKPELDPRVTELAGRVASRFASRKQELEAADLKQDLILHAIEDKLDYNTLDTPLIYTIFRRRASKIVKAHTKTTGEPVVDHYTIDQIKALLPYVFNGTEEFTSGTSATENIRAMVADIYSATTLLSTENRNVLRLRYGQDLKVDVLASELGFAHKSNASSAVSRALKALHEALQGEPPTWTRQPRKTTTDYLS